VKAYRERTQPPHREPPYDRVTCFFVLETDAYSRGRSATTYRIRSDVRNAARDQHWKTHPAELGAAVTALGCSSELFDVVVAEVTAGGLDNAPS
jgi:hypothetical protein